MPRVRFAPSPTGYLHIGSARTFIFNWLYARHNHGTMILRIDDTDVDRNTDVSLQSIYDGLKWLDLGWDEHYRQSERLDLHRTMANAILARDLAYRDFTPAVAQAGEEEDATTTAADRPKGAWLFNAGMRDIPREESDRRAAAGEPFVLRYRVPRGTGRVIKFEDGVYGAQSKEADDVEDFALLRSNAMPTYHMASCADDADLKISNIIRGQDHLSNTFKHILIFEALGVAAPEFAHLPLLIAPDGAKLSKRKHGPVVSVTTYRDNGFLAHTYVNFLCLLGWSPKDNREQMSRQGEHRLPGTDQDGQAVNCRVGFSLSYILSYKHQSQFFLRVHRHQAVLALVDAGKAVFVRDVAQPAFDGVGPGVVRADEGLGAALALREPGAAVAAGIAERAHLAVRAAHRQDRHAGGVARDPGTGFRQRRRRTERHRQAAQ